MIYTNVIIDHNGKCDVEWVEGNPTWKRAIEQHGMARVCGKCFNKIDSPMMPYPGQSGNLDDAKPKSDS